MQNTEVEIDSFKGFHHFQVNPSSHSPVHCREELHDLVNIYASDKLGPLSKDTLLPPGKLRI